MRRLLKILLLTFKIFSLPSSFQLRQALLEPGLETGGAVT